MVYIVFVNPSILGVAGMDTQVVFVTTCLIAAFGTIAMGLFSNLPIALAPAMGLNAFCIRSGAKIRLLVASGYGGRFS